MLLSAFSETALAALGLQASTSERSGAAFVEFLALLTGTKKLVRLVVEADKLLGIQLAVMEAGLKIAISPQELVTCHINQCGDRFQAWGDLTGNMPRAVYISKDQQISDHAAELDLHGNDQSLSVLLGYPRCCQEAYNPNRYQNWWYHISCMTETRLHLASVMNRMSRLYSSASYLYDYFPCSLNCEFSREIALTNRQMLLTHGCNEIVDNWDRMQAGEFLVFPNSIITFTGNTWKTRLGVQSSLDSNIGIKLRFESP